ncbi:hypothetical protein [Falsiroseomonas oryzae]|uniref:hypothetical protein n=1 Tax=Falsiroseomonas oryzae TaxID=2766473 RepID=UPI0022EB24FC|nr:hypothetical protein [Roseomonas sp. MO-31]
MPELQDRFVCLTDLAQRRAVLVERLQQLEVRSDGIPCVEAQSLRGELQALDRELRLVAGSN